MKNKGAIVFGVVGFIIIAIVTIYFYSSSGEVEEVETTDWTYTYDVKDEGPYGLNILYDLLDYSNKDNTVFLVDRENLSLALADENPDQHDMYIFIGQIQYLTLEDRTALNTFTAKGNSVLCITDGQNDLMEKTIVGYQRDFYYDSIVNLWLNNSITGTSYKLPYIFEADTVNETWDYFNLENSEDFEVLGQLDGDKINYVRHPYGNGNFFFHSNPYLFTNVSIWNSEEGVSYVEDVISFLPKGDIYWDEYTKTPPPPPEKVTSPLQFILNNPPLLWAYCIFLVGLLLMLIFNSKRKTKAIPGKEINQNHSQEFINTISEIYRNANRPDQLMKMKEKTFIEFINRKYFFNYNSLDLENAKAIAQKSEIEENLVIEIINGFNNYDVNLEAVRNSDIIDINEKIEYFYQNCK